jgi:KAP family P-loop domain
VPRDSQGELLEELKKSANERALEVKQPIWSVSARRLFAGATIVARGTGADQVSATHFIATYVLAPGDFHVNDYRELGLDRDQLADSLLQHLDETNDPARRRFRALIKGPADAVTPSDGEISAGFSPSVAAVIDSARRLASASGPVSAAALFYAMLVQGEEGDGDTAQWFRGLIASLRWPEIEAAHALRPRSKVASHEPTGFLAADALAWIEAARDLARRVARRQGVELGTRHILGAALRPDALAFGFASEVEPRFQASGLAVDAIRESLLEHVVTEHDVEDDALVWNELLLKSPGVATDQNAAVFVSDVVAGADQLNIDDEARAFALLGASDKVEPPLAVGVFGDWGSGKSFFMDRIKAFVAEINDKKIVQIHFNAWHYVESNLWASLAHRLFAELRRALGRVDEGDLATQAEAKAKAVTQLFAVLERAATEGAARTVRLEQAEKDRANAEKSLADARADAAKQEATLREVVLATTEIAGSQLPPTLAKEIDELLTAAGKTRDEVDAVLRDATAAREVIASVLEVRRTRELGDELRRVAYAAAIVVTLGGFLLWQRLVPETWATLTAVVAQAAATLAVWRRYASRARAIAARAAGLLDGVSKAVAEKKQDESKRVREAQEKLADAHAKEQSARRDLDSANEDIRTIVGQIEAARPERQLLSLVDERVEQGTYAKLLSLVETLRDDLERLSLVLATPGHDKKEMKRRAQLLKDVNIELKDLPSVRRIILYIDDLDRCPHEKVSEVLQAVHLLLAFPLFVVIVAIDARWATQALNQAHPGLLGAKESNHQGATAFDYLEKIFQIPYWVKPMTPIAARRLLSHLMAGTEEGDPVAPKALPPIPPGRPEPSVKEEGSATGAAQDALDGAARQGGSAGAAVVQTPVAAAAGAWPRIDRLRVGDEERRFANRLAPALGDSPRRLKRFVNLYRLFKATLSPAEWTLFRRPQSEAVLTLLAIQTGAPQMAPEILDDLANDRRSGGGDEGALTGSAALPALTAPRSPVRPPEELAHARHALREFDNTGAASSALKLWAARIARYSFRTEAVPFQQPGRP